MNTQQRGIVKQWVAGIVILSLILSANTYLQHHAGVVKIVLIASTAILYALATINGGKSLDATQISFDRDYRRELFADFFQKQWVVVYYGIVTCISILIASKAAREGVNPFENLGINFIFLGLLVLAVPGIVTHEVRRFHETDGD